MKTIFIIALLSVVPHSVFSQTTLTVDANDALNSNSKIVAQTVGGQSFFTGHQLGSTYSFPYGIFRAWSDNPNGAYNYFYDGVAGGTTNYYVRADGQGYFASNVGIGAANPTARLTLGGNTNPNPNGATEQDYAGLSMSFREEGSAGAFDLGVIKMVQPAGAYVDAADMVFSTRYGGLGEKMRITRAGYLGIGTSSPSSLLTINTSLDPNSNPSILLNNTNTNYGSSISFATTGTVKGVVRSDQNGNLGIDGKGAGNIDFNYYGSNGDVNFWRGVGTGDGAGTINFVIKNNGNVGIGTTDNNNWRLATSTYKLAVGGNVLAEGITIKLQSAWPDYVFNSTYQLKPLSEIKSYIFQNHHLPDMPSAAEVEKDGLNLGEMNKLLTKKVEEVTLYLIEKDKQLIDQKLINDKQSAINQSLQNEINDLKSMIIKR